MTMGVAAPAEATTTRERVAARVLRLFARVEPEEAATAATLTLTVFLLLTAYYFLKTAREPLILLHGGAEVKSYASAGQSLLLMLVLPAYAALARRVGRLTLLVSIYSFFIVNLLVFVALVRANVNIAVVFYLWVGVFSLTAIAQFWSYANDVYTPEQGERLFAIVGIGSSVGAVAGGIIAGSLAALGPAAMMLGAALLLVLCIGLLVLVDRRERREHQRPGQTEQPLLEGSALKLLLNDRYLVLIAGMIFLLNCVNSNGEYLLDRTLLAALADGAAGSVNPVGFIGAFKASYFTFVNWIGVGLQLFAVSRVLRVIGVRKALFILPIIAFTGYSVMIVAPVLALIRVAKIAENSLDYSLQNTARQALYLVGTRAEKYLGKTTIDTFIVRIGDVFSAALVFTAAQLGLPTKVFAMLNLGLIACWLLVLVALGREHARREAELTATPELGSTP